ncbi:MAG: hypothetical protein INR71_14455, partial [Terriglobus roseus]|nr:hypothetical protein [Terriglobus roseus]
MVPRCAAANTSFEAVDKLPSISSAGLLRKLQEQFNPSKFFAPWLEQERKRLDDDFSRQKGRPSGKQRKKLQNLQVKLGHGGTLDPMASGVLIVGVGSGTKQLNSFLACTKSYDTVVVFGTATDSYDAWGKVTGRAPTEQITKEKVEEA